MKFQPVPNLADGGKVRIGRNPHPAFHIIFQQSQRNPLTGCQFLVTHKHAFEGALGSFILHGHIFEIIVQR